MSVVNFNRVHLNINHCVPFSPGTPSNFQYVDSRLMDINIYWNIYSVPLLWNFLFWPSSKSIIFYLFFNLIICGVFWRGVNFSLLLPYSLLCLTPSPLLASFDFLLNSKRVLLHFFLHFTRSQFCHFTYLPHLIFRPYVSWILVF